MSALDPRRFLYRSLDPDGAWDRYVRTRAAPLGTAGGLYTTYRLSAGRSLSIESPSTGAALPIKSIEVNVKKEEAAALTDGDLQTRWDTGPQTGKEEMLIDLGTVHPITTVVLQLGPFNADFPRDLLIETSHDRRSWTEAWRGSTTILAFSTAVRDPRRVPLVFPLGSREARFIRLRQLGRDSTYYWSVAELSLH